jgi:hypothetical protein
VRGISGMFRTPALAERCRRTLSACLSSGSEVLDIGAGPGGDPNRLVGEKCEPRGPEPGAYLRERAPAFLPHPAGGIDDSSLPGFSRQIDRKFAGVLSAAVSQHAPEEQFLDAVLDIRSLLIKQRLSAADRQSNWTNLC